LVFDPDGKPPDTISGEMVILKFSIPRRYHGLQGVKRIGSSFPTNWKLSDAFHDIIRRVILHESRALLDERHQKQLMRRSEWWLYRKIGRVRKVDLDPAQSLAESDLKGGDIVYAKRMRIL